MRFNEKELINLAISTSVQFDKEGCLFMLDKEGRYLKRTEGYIERLFRLKGNILLYFKSTKRELSPLGCFILENCKIERYLSPDKDLVFMLKFVGDESRPILLAASSVDDYHSWTNAIAKASYEGLRSQVASLRKQLKELRNSIKPISMADKAMDEYFDISDIAGIELSIGCTIMESNSSLTSPPSTLVSLKLWTNSTTVWEDHSQTEICENSYEPFYLTSALLNFKERCIKPSTQMQFTLFIVQNRKKGIMQSCGQASCQIQQVLQALNQKISFKIRPIGQWTGDCHINIVAWKLRDGGSAVALRRSAAIDAHSDNKAPIKLPDTRTIRPFKNNNLIKKCENLCTKTYRFPVADAGSSDELECLRVTEMMGETKLSFLLPQQLIMMYIASEKLAIEEFNRLGELKPHWASIREKVIKEHSDLVVQYEMSLQDLKQFKGQYFKPSKCKGDKRYEFISTNLHVQAIAILDPLDKEYHYCVATVGAAAAHTMKFKNGGMYKQLRQLSTRESTISSLDNTKNDEQSLRELKATTRVIFARFREHISKLKSLVNSFPVNGEDLKSIQHTATDCVRHLLCIHANKTVLSLIDEIEFCRKVALSPEQTMANIESTLRILDQDDDWEWTESSSLPLSRSQSLKGKTYPKIDEAIKSLTSAVNAFQTNRSAEYDVKNAIEVLENLMCELVSQIVDAVTMARLKEENNKIEVLKTIRNRRDIVFSQAVSALVASFYYKLTYDNVNNPNYYQQLMTIGYLASFESLLSNYGEETGMLEDMWIGVKDCQNVIFKLSKSKERNGAIAIPTISGSRSQLVIEIGIEERLFSRLPVDLKTGRKEIRTVPVLFTIGINEHATIAEKLGQVAFQDSINDWSYTRLCSYYEQYKALYPNIITSKSKNPPPLNVSVARLNEIIDKKSNKNIRVLIKSEEICRRVDGGRITCCKSGKDRTSMAVTLEQCCILKNEHNLDKAFFERALETMRSEGPRRKNTWKNAEAKCYAFNRTQVMVLPSLYKPPAGTYGSAQT